MLWGILCLSRTSLPALHKLDTHKNNMEYGPLKDFEVKPIEAPLAAVQMGEFVE